jgi:hypothetical protein
MSFTSSHSLDDLVQRPLRKRPVEPRPEGHVVVDRHRERHRRLEHHADPRTDMISHDLRPKHVLAVEQHLALDMLVGIEVVHAVERAQQR